MCHWLLGCLQDMRYFFLMLVFLLVSFGLTFSVLMSPATTSKVNLVSLVGTAPGTEGAVAGSELQVFGSLEVRRFTGTEEPCL